MQQITSRIDNIFAALEGQARRISSLEERPSPPVDQTKQLVQEPVHGFQTPPPPPPLVENPSVIP